MINLSQQGYSHEQIISMLHRADGFDYAEYKLQVIRDNAWVIDAKFTSANLECSYFSQVKYSSSLTIKDDPRINWKTDYIKPIMTWPIPGGHLEFSFIPLKPMTVLDSIKRTDIYKEVEAYDESIILQGNTIGDEIVFPAGTLYVSAIEQLLLIANFKNVNIAYSDKKIATDRQFEPQDEILTTANLLLSEMNYRSLEMGIDGVLTSYKYELPTIEQARIHYKAGEKSIIMPEKSISRDSYKRPNRFIGYLTNPEFEEPLRYEFVNDNPASPTSTINQGYVITAPPRQFNNIADYDSLVDNVHQWANEEGQIYEYTKLLTAVMPHHEVREVITVDSFGANGVYTETGWKIKNFKRGGIMEHELRVINYG